MFWRKNKKLKEDQNRVFNILINLIQIEETILDDKYKKSHGKIALNYKDHVVEIIEEDHGEKFKVKYFKSKICLTKKQYKKILESFETELKKRSGCIKDFSTLESILKNI